MIFWLYVICSGRLHRFRALSRRDLGIAFLLGAVGYSAQSGLAFASLDRLDASLFALLIAPYPAFVTIAAIAIRREAASRRTAIALILASSGLVLVLAGATAGAFDSLGAVFALAAAAVYSAYILSSQAARSCSQPSSCSERGLLPSSPSTSPARRSEPDRVSRLTADPGAPASRIIVRWVKRSSSEPLSRRA